MAGGQAVHIHGSHHDAHPLRAGALQTVEHRQQIAIESMLVFIFEDHVRIVDENHGRRVPLGLLEHVGYLAIETCRSPLRPSHRSGRTCSSGGGPARVRWLSFPCREARPEVLHAWVSAPAAAASASFSNGSAILASRARITSSTPFKSFQSTGWTSSRSTLLTMCLRMQVIDEALRVELGIPLEPQAGFTQLVTIQLGREAMDLAEVQPRSQFRAEVNAANTFEIGRSKIVNLARDRPAAELATGR